jgi:hypothetical protein
MKKLILAVLLITVASVSHTQQDMPVSITLSTIVMCQPTSVVIAELTKAGMVPFITSRGSVNAFTPTTEKITPLYGTTEVYMNLSPPSKFAIILTLRAKGEATVDMSCITGIGAGIKPHPQAMLKGDVRL